MIGRFISAACGLVLFALLAACASQVAIQPGDAFALPQRADNVENVSIIRDRSTIGLAKAVYVSVDGRRVGTLRQGEESLNFGLENGSYDIGLECDASNTRLQQRPILILQGSGLVRRGVVSIDVDQDASAPAEIAVSCKTGKWNLYGRNHSSRLFRVADHPSELFRDDN